MSNNVCLSSLSDEELLRHVYLSPGVRTAIELELAARLEHALKELRDEPDTTPVIEGPPWR